MECNHIFIVTEVDIEEITIRQQKNIEICDRYCCLICGKINVFRSLFSIDDEYEISENFYPCICDEQLAKAIYRKIITSYPSISEKETLEFLKASLHNIRTKEKTKKVLTKRKKRLGLNSNFINWDINSVVHHQ